MRRSQSSFTLLLNANTTYNLLLIPSLQHRKDISKNLRTVSTLDCFDLETSSSIAFSQGVEKHKKQERYACKQILQREYKLHIWIITHRTKSVLVGLEGLVKKVVGLCGWHWLVLTNGIEVKFQRNALSVIDGPTGNEEDDDLEFKNFQWNGSDMVHFCVIFFKEWTIKNIIFELVHQK
ncbi:uncharacterized protein LOC116024376 [Ipomoea triloba]|uniref:uncharacterized protein LOC116024376 n=1 Tax=Ipomoea triloba TaxID=35885 RepID=UPI00125CFF6E|nr:uncharacterized protein LOC116024376 [Ipomoea triloba]